MSDLKNWKVEEKVFLKSIGKKVATRNLWISIHEIRNEQEPNRRTR
jgi:hypothetical protein